MNPIPQLLHQRLLQAFPATPTAEQLQAMECFVEFMTDSSPYQSLMILKGSAGTGKTTLAAAIVRAMTGLRQRIVLLAPTGRAAKVMETYSGHIAFTIHRRIYRQKVAGGFAPFTLGNNLLRDCLFIVDESSMIANRGMTDSSFGTGCLLDDLVNYVYQGESCRLLLIGDSAQLPPVGEAESPALQAEVMEGYGMRIYEAQLNQVLRQSQQSGILYNATRIRQLITHDELTQLPLIRLQGFADVSVVMGNELIETLASS